MWLRLLIVFLLFGFLGILQNSFLAHFNVMGATANLIFILFYSAVFFSASGKPALSWEDLFYCAAAGFFLDVFSCSFLGISVIFLLIVAFIVKYGISQLKITKDKYPIAYFAPLFLISFIVYNLLSAVVAGFNLNWVFLIEIVYNLVFALFGFYIYKTLKLYEFEK